DRVYVHPFHL
nr:angiotensin I [Trachemys scripta]prf//560088A angiotensin I [Bos taurus]prf//570121A angiotensin [Bos taurus]